MAKPAKKSLVPKPPAPDGALGWPPRRATADPRLRIPPAGFVQRQITRVSEADDRGAHDDEEGDACAMNRLLEPTGELDPCRGFGKPPVSLSPGSLAAAAPSRAATRIAGAERKPRARPEIVTQRFEKIDSAPEICMASETSDPQDVVYGRRGAAWELPADDENFPCCKALKSHEMEKESIDLPSPPRFHGCPHGEGSGVGRSPFPRADQMRLGEPHPRPLPVKERGGETPVVIPAYCAAFAPNRALGGRCLRGRPAAAASPAPREYDRRGRRSRPGRQDGVPLY
jgi:hypothetical protein